MVIIMAETKAKSNKSTKKTNSSKKGGSRRKKNSSDDTIKFLLVLVIAGIAIAMIFFSQSEANKTGNVLSGTPTPTVSAEVTTSPEHTDPQPTGGAGTGTLPENTPAPTQEADPTATPTPEPTPTVTPTPAVTAEQAKAVVAAVVDESKYNIQLINDHLIVADGVYYQFSAIKEQELIYPFLVVSKADGSLHFFDSTDETVFDVTTFPLVQEAEPTEAPVQTSELTAEEAYKVLCSYSKDSLKIAKEASEYNAEYDSELTLVNGVNCYRINLSEVSGGKVRNRGEFYVSVDGAQVFYINSETNEFVPANK